jgi:HEAT repeat protein
MRGSGVLSLVAALLPSLVSALASPDVSVRIETIADLARSPKTARPLLAAIVVDASAPIVARIWAMIGMSQVRDEDDGVVVQALVQVLDAPEVILRRCSIETLGNLKVERAVAKIAEHLTDDEAIPEAWFEDTLTPAQAARQALKTIGTPAAIAALNGSVVR